MEMNSEYHCKQATTLIPLHPLCFCQQVVVFRKAVFSCIQYFMYMQIDLDLTERIIVHHA